MNKIILVLVETLSLAVSCSINFVPIFTPPGTNTRHKFDVQILNYFERIIECEAAVEYLSIIDRENVIPQYMGLLSSVPQVATMQTKLRESLDRVIDKLDKAEKKNELAIIWTVHRFLGAVQFITLSHNAEIMSRVLDGTLIRKGILSPKQTTKITESFREIINKVKNLNYWGIRVVLLLLISRIGWSSQKFPIFTNILVEYVGQIAEKWASNPPSRPADNPLLDHAKQTLGRLDFLAEFGSDMESIEDGIKRIITERSAALTKTNSPTIH